ncbi:hypothetical protein [Rhodanobacter glycinis]|uniref:hypothetical protein n=1 Tax=Rhodanobacter glycinis TaxID=582702 RepID=UPI00137605FA|nr:hypothetical protein [Rhodanobacter glycinis]
MKNPADLHRRGFGPQQFNQPTVSPLCWQKPGWQQPCDGGACGDEPWALQPPPELRRVLLQVLPVPLTQPPAEPQSEPARNRKAQRQQRAGKQSEVYAS